MPTQLSLGLDGPQEEFVPANRVQPFKRQLLKWIGNKQRVAHEIVSHFPQEFAGYIEPFLGSGAVLGTLAPKEAIASDVLRPLIDIWQTLATDPDRLKTWYAERLALRREIGKVESFERIKAAYNARPNAADLLFVSRMCYGGVVRFRRDGYISTPCGAHEPISEADFAERVEEWHRRTKGAVFIHADFEAVMERATPGSVVYCDPPYTHTQAILYGAQSFDLQRLLRAIARCKDRGVYVLLSIDGSKRSGNLLCDVPIPDGLFEKEALLNCGRSMLRRFQMRGESLEGEVVRDRLLLTF